MPYNHDYIEKVLDRLSAVRGLRRSDTEKPHKFLFLLTLARLYELNPQRSRIILLDSAHPEMPIWEGGSIRKNETFLIDLQF